MRDNDPLIRWIRANGGLRESPLEEGIRGTPEPPPDGGPRMTPLARWLRAQTEPSESPATPPTPDAPGPDAWIASLTPVAAEQARRDPDFARELHRALLGLDPD